jgi:signal transduction histidine kinase
MSRMALPAVSSSDPPAAQAESLGHLLRCFALRGLVITAIGCALALLLTLDAPPVRRQLTLLYTGAITLGCWFCIDGSIAFWQRVVAPRIGGLGEADSRWPPWPVLALLLPLGTAVGYSAGQALANALSGRNDPGLLAAALSGRTLSAAVPLVLAMLPGLVAMLYFRSRERMASIQAQAQAAQRAATESRLQLLLTQLEPHMLFNTLANLRVLITLDPPRAQAMLDRLIAYLRATLVASRSGEHALATEFQRLDDYLALMSVRMGPRLQVQLDLPAELRQLPVPALLLQPLVENCIQHGLEPQVAGGRIEVSARRDGGQLLLQVRDTGVGLRAGAASPGQGPAGTGFGLAQVRERLAVLHGDAATLRVQAADDAEGGTRATISLPWPAGFGASAADGAASATHTATA